MKKKINTNKLMSILFFSLLFIIGTCFFLKSDFFYLDKVIIKNNKYLVKEDVNTLLGIETDKNIFFYNLSDLEKRVEKSSYIKSCKIKRKMPNQLIVNIKEKRIIGPLYNGKTYCYMDDKGNLVNELKEVKTDNPVIYIGFSLNNKSFELNNENDKKKLIILYIKLDEENILKQIKTIDLRNKSLINMKGKTGLTIRLSKNNNVEKNIVRLSNILVDLQSRNEVYGKIDLLYNNYILYSPYYD